LKVFGWGSLYFYLRILCPVKFSGSLVKF
jgi:hypothetical protein